MRHPIPPAEPVLEADDLRVPNETEALRKGILLAALTCAIPLGLVITLAIVLESPVVWLVAVLILAWSLVAYGLLLRAGRAFAEEWDAHLRDSPPVATPATRLMPQTIVFDITRLLPSMRGISAVVVTGSPRILSLPGRIVIAHELYRQTTDRDLLMLFLHEIGHHFAGHLPLLHLVQALPALEERRELRLLLLPTQPFRQALREWLLWADVTADRLALLLKPEVNLAILGMIKQVGLTREESEQREHLARFLNTTGALTNRGEQLNASAQLTELFASHPELETRIHNLRLWRDSEAFVVIGKRHREALAKRRKV